jgi:predicted transcriptional regulator
MHIIEPGGIRKKRLSLGLTQMELAKRAGVTQSILARIESGKVDPRYSNIKKISLALESFNGRGVLARNIMTKNVIVINHKDRIRKAVRLMKRKGISQLPVMDNGKIIGTIHEKNISHMLSQGKTANTSVEEVMDDVLPTVPENTSVNTLSSLLDHYPAVLILEGGRITGIVSRADLLKLVKK